MFIGESTYPGRIFKVSLDGHVLGVIGRSGRQPKAFSGAHALACPSDHEIYAAETANWRVQKVSLRQPAATPGATQAAGASDLHVISSIGIRGALQKMLPEFERASGRKVTVDWGTTAGLKRELEGGRTFDVTILTPGAIDDLIKEHIIAEGTHTGIAQTFLGIGVRPGAPRADVSTADAIKRRLLAAKTITFSKEGASTAALLEMMRRLGIADQMAVKTALQTVSGRPAESVMEGQNEIVLAPLSELRVAGIQILGPLPKEFQVPVVMSAGIAAASTNAAAAKELVAFLTSATMIPLITASGMEVVR
jgi:molybdate transport system substrate-binding protein